MEQAHPEEIRRDTVDRFCGLAATYDRHRPDYPAAAIDHILAHCGLGPGSHLVDIGCGTGISARQFAALGLSVTGIEPNAEMRQAAQASNGPIDYRDGRADATGRPDACADAVLAAQAFHWFASDAALAEFRRILKPGGWVVLIWNEPDRTDAFTAGYSDLLRHYSPDRAVATLAQSATGDVLLQSPLFVSGHRVEFTHRQAMTADQLIGRAGSVSFGPRDAAARARFDADLRQLHGRFAAAGIAVMRYRTAVYLARAPLVPA